MVMLGSKKIGETKLDTFRRVGVRLGTLCGVFGILFVCLGAQCIGTQPPPPPDNPPGFENADAGSGGALYDEWWAVVDLTAPTTDHPLWAARPDQTSNTRTGAATWRCKECHGWDYKGVEGAYGSGSHRTGIAGIFGTTRSAQEIFDLIKTTHGYGAAGLADADILDLAKFVLEAQIDTDDIIDAGSKAFIGLANSGMGIFDANCAVCHGADGTQLLFDEGTVTLGGLADDNPWEVQHKIRFGQPGTAMPRQLVALTVPEVGDLGAYAQSLVDAPPPAGCTADADCAAGQVCTNGECVDEAGCTVDGDCAAGQVCTAGVCVAGGGGGGDVAAGLAFYTANGCAVCHGADATGGIGSNIQSESAASIFARLSGAETHAITVPGVTEQNTQDLEAWLSSL